jgi:hypothetical protein
LLTTPGRNVASEITSIAGRIWGTRLPGAFIPRISVLIDRTAPVAGGVGNSPSSRKASRNAAIVCEPTMPSSLSPLLR